MNLEEYKVGW